MAAMPAIPAIDDEASRRLIAQAVAQHAREEIKRARANLPIGVVLLGLGIAISSAAAILPLGLIGMVVVGGVGFVLVPGGLAVMIKSAGAIASANRRLRALEPPAARVLSG